MLIAFTSIDSLWPSLLGVVIGGFIAAGTAYSGQLWTERRERRNKRDDLRLALYLEVVDMVCVNQLEIAKSLDAGRIPSVDLQTKRIRIAHKLKLLGSQPVFNSYNAYDLLVMQATSFAVEHRPHREALDHARDRLIEMMGKDVQAASLCEDSN